LLHQQISRQSEKLHSLTDELSKILHFPRTINRILPANLTYNSPDYHQHTKMKQSHLLATSQAISHAILAIIQSPPPHSTKSSPQRLQMQAVRHPAARTNMTQPSTTAIRRNQRPNNIQRPSPHLIRQQCKQFGHVIM